MGSGRPAALFAANKKSKHAKRKKRDEHWIHMSHEARKPFSSARVFEVCAVLVQQRKNMETVRMASMLAIFFVRFHSATQHISDVFGGSDGGWLF